MQNTVTARIDLSALRDNLDVVRKFCPNSRVMSMVKADAYGHGLIPVARALRESDGLAVARMKEALCLRQAGIKQRILLLGTLLEAADLTLCSQLGIDVTAHDAAAVANIATMARRFPLRVWLKLDSGMHRMGLEPQAFIEADKALRSHPGITELVHMTHLSSAEDPDSVVTNRQIACFAACHSENPTAKASLANSAALITRPEVHADWVRPGIMLYGDNPVVSHSVAVRPAMTLVARVIAVRDIGAGESVGYNGCWTSSRPSRIATLGLGYADGYPRHARIGTPVWINAMLAPLVGRVSMDSLGVDVTDCERVSIGDEAVLWGPQLPASIVAKHCDSISYALLSCVTGRVEREYAN